MSNWLLKIHLFLFHASIACLVVYLTVYYKTFTDCSYHEVGLLVMFTCLGSAMMKPLVCSYADRHGNYKRCLMIAIGVNALSTVTLSVVPFYPQLLFEEPHPRLMWYLVAVDSFLGHVCLGLAVTLSDVFVIHECLHSRSAEHFGQYRIYGGLGWAVISVSVAIAEQYNSLPYLALPLLVSSLCLLVDLPLIGLVKEITRRADSSCHGDGGGRGSISASGDRLESHRKSGPKQQASATLNMAVKQPSIANTLISAHKTVGKGPPAASMAVYATVEPNRLKQTGLKQQAAPSSLERQIYGPAGGFDQMADARGSPSSERISFMTQLVLLRRLSSYDRHHLIKYLIQFILMGAFLQTHYIFYLQYFSEILNARGLIGLLFTLSALIQISDSLGQTVGLLWVARVLIDNLGRDISFMLALLIAGSRSFVIGFLAAELSPWTLAMLEIQTGLLYGISYTLMIEIASAYLSILDNLLLVESTDAGSGGGCGEAEFQAKLDELKERYSIESIRFAIRATVQGIFSGACEGLGFALGPLLAGIWLSMRADSLETLYHDMALTQFAVLLATILIEFVLMRLLFGSRSKVDTLMIGRQALASSQQY